VKVLVTGAHGLLGRSLVEAADKSVDILTCGRRDEPVGGSYSKLDLSDPVALNHFLAKKKPDWVIHTAAWTDVDGCEGNPSMARRTNLDLVQNLVEISSTLAVRVVQLSTDYVFDGRKGPYAEDDKPHPLSHYGRIKLESEQAVLVGEPGGLVVRTLWLYGHTKGVRRNLVTWPLEAIANGKALKIANDQWGNPTFALDAANAILELCKKNCRGLYHVGGADFMTRLQLVQKLVSVFGCDETAMISSVKTADLNQDAVRPLRSGLLTQKLELELKRPTVGLSEGLARMRSDKVFRSEFESGLSDATS
tara:strand:+ start:122 stop:1042 length:921 start_codon:yes stop_codon:yes gene_type:complete